MAKLIGTAGHVDHGKTTLIKALTGIDADRLPEEKKRGMTIDIGFAYLDLPEYGRVSIVDVPGHERFIHNMLVGAQGIDVALLCVAADESVMPQTREHLQILELLPVDRMVVALTKSDMADQETREIAKLEVEELLEPTRFKGAPMIEVSAMKGMGLEELKTELSKTLSEGHGRDTDQHGPSSVPKTEHRAPKTLPWYLPIDRAFTVKGHGVVVTGTLARGSVRVGARAFIEPGHVEVRVRSIHSHGDALESSEKGKRTALNLGGIKMEDVHRGQAVGEPGALFETSLLDASMRWLKRPRHAQRVRISLGSEEIIGKVLLSDSNPDIAQLRLESGAACALGQPLIVRNYSPPELIGGGQVLVPNARLRKKSEAVKPKAAKALGSEAIVDALAGQESGLVGEEMARRLGHDLSALTRDLDSLRESGRILNFAGAWFESESFEKAKERFLAGLAKLHEKNPTEAMSPREKAAAAAGLNWTGKPFDRIVASLVETGELLSSGTQVRLPSFSVQLNARQRELLDRVASALASDMVNVPTPAELALSIRVPPQAIDEILRIGIEAGEIVRVSDGLFYAKSQIEQIKRRMRETFGSGPFPASGFRDAFGTSRKYTIPLLEYLDSVRFTLRVGDNRVINKA